MALNIIQLYQRKSLSIFLNVLIFVEHSRAVLLICELDKSRVPSWMHKFDPASDNKQFSDKLISVFLRGKKQGKRTDSRQARGHDGIYSFYGHFHSDEYGSWEHW